MSGGSGKIKYWEYHGSLAGVVCNGPVDTLEEIIVDGETAWKGPLNRGSATNYSTITVDSRRVIRFYWGTETQTVDPLLNPGGNSYGHEHPAYKGVCYIVLVDFFFGRERTSAPNIEVVVSRKPQQSVFVNGAADLYDGQASPVATLADFLTHPRHGLGLAAAGFDLGPWFATADQLFLNNQHPNTYISALLNQQVPTRQAVAEMALNADLWLRFNPETETIEAGAWPHDATIDVSTLSLLTADELTERPKFEGGGWGESETGWAITFTDRDRGFKETTEKHDDLRALRIVGDHRRATLKRPWIMRRDQAFFHVTEYGKSKGQPVIKGELTVRRVKAIGIRPGDLIRVDIDPEPGGLQVQQVFRVTERTVPQTGPIKLRIEAEMGISPVVFTPTADLPDSPQQTEPPAIAHQRVFELPAPLASGGIQVGVLAERPHDLVTGVNVHYDSATSGAFQFLGVQEVFALRGSPTDGWDETSNGPFEIEIYSTRDRDMIDDDPGPTAARDNQLLMVCIHKDASGAVAEDANGFPIIEIYSIEAFTQTGYDAYAVTAYRERFGTKRRSFWMEQSECWIIPGFGLKGFGHRDFAVLQNLLQTGYFRLQPFTIFAQRELSGCADIPFTFPTSLAYAPQVAFTTPATATLQYSSPPGNVSFAGTVTDADGNLTHFSLLRRAADGTEETLFSLPLNPTGLYNFERTVSFSDPGSFTLIARAQDSTGRITDSEIAIEIDQPAGKVATPSISPSGGFIRTSRSVSITCATAGAAIEYAKVLVGNPAPSTGWIAYTGAFTVFPNTRVWARATASGLTASDYARADFYRDESIYGGNYIEP
ncbi:MAG: hypothetical protein ACP5I4_16450 [Oceanipulchritudo sp.]